MITSMASYLLVFINVYIWSFLKLHCQHISVSLEREKGESHQCCFPDNETRSKGFRTRIMAEKFILLIDDERYVCQTIEAHLKKAGYGGRCFEVALDALSFFNRHSNKIDLVITDLIMPGMKGTEVAERMRSLRPDLPIILMTGYPDPEMPPDKVPLFSRIMFKPFTRGELREALRNALRT